MLRAYVHENYLGMNVAVSIVRHPDGEAQYNSRVQIMRFGTGGRTHGWEAIEDPTMEIEPSLVLAHEEARVLLDALAEHYQGASDMRLLRQDRDHERGRVDKLLDVVSKIAEGRP